MTRAFSRRPAGPSRVALAVLAAGAAVAGCTAEPRYPITPGSDGPRQDGWVTPDKPRYPIHPGPAADAAAAADAGAPPPPPPPPVRREEETRGPVAAAGSVDARPLAPLGPAAPIPYAELKRAPARGVAPLSVRPIPPEREARTPAVPARRAPPTRTYVMVAHDTFYGVGRRFSTPPRALAEANDVSLSATLQPGRRLTLPASARDGGTQTGAQGRVVETPGKLLAAAVPSRPRRARDLDDEADASDRPPPAHVHPGRTEADAQGAAALAASRAPARPPAVVLAAPFAVAANAPPAPSTAADSGVASGRGRFVWPVRGAVLSTFGPKGPGQRNDGVDIAATEGDAVRAAAGGQVVYAGHDVPALGNLVAVKHADGWVTIYANLQRITVRPRDQVAQGAQVGLAGRTGAAERAQVHFEVRYAPQPTEKARPVDPQLVLPGA